jgi:hypothetical protein
MPLFIKRITTENLLKSTIFWDVISLMFWRNKSPPYSEPKSKPRKKTAEAGGKLKKTHVENLA